MAPAAEIRRARGWESFPPRSLRPESVSKATAAESLEFPVARRSQSRTASPNRRAPRVPACLAESPAGAAGKNGLGSFPSFGFFVHPQLRHIGGSNRIGRVNEIARRIDPCEPARFHQPDAGAE